jgi:hypothetical protein
MRTRQIYRGDDVKHPKGFFLRKEEQEHPGDEIKRLRVPDLGIMKRKGIENPAERQDHLRFRLHSAILRVTVARMLGMVHSLRFEMEIVGEGSVEVTLNVFFIVIIRRLHGTPYKLVVKPWVSVHMVIPTSIPEPCRASELGWYSFAHKALHSGGCGREI